MLDVQSRMALVGPRREPHLQAVRNDRQAVTCRTCHHEPLTAGPHRGLCGSCAMAKVFERPMWKRVGKFTPEAATLADRHYSRRIETHRESSHGGHKAKPAYSWANRQQKRWCAVANAGGVDDAKRGITPDVTLCGYPPEAFERLPAIVWTWDEAERLVVLDGTFGNAGTYPTTVEQILLELGTETYEVARPFAYHPDRHGQWLASRETLFLGPGSAVRRFVSFAPVRSDAKRPKPLTEGRLTASFTGGAVGRWVVVIDPTNDDDA